jgi:cation diffusion facilitator CzcD-associated flavoprotein CzcO
MSPEHHRIVVIGAGFAGVGIGVRLLQRGIHDFVICERNDSVGGTWFEHTYPGCACDIPTHLYSYSFARNPRWTRLFPRQEEILEYVRRIADEHGVTEKIRFGCEMERSAWDGRTGRWRVRTSQGTFTCDVLVSAIGRARRAGHPGARRVRGASLPLGPLGPWAQRRRRARGGDRDRAGGGAVRALHPA